MFKQLSWNKAVTALKNMTMASVIAISMSAATGMADAPDSKTQTPKLPRLVDLGAKQCIPCKKMAPILDELTSEYAGIMDVEFIDVWQKENAVKAQKYGIESIPTQIFFDANGKELWRHEGYISKEDILAKLKSLGYDLEILKKEKPTAKDTK